MSCQETTVCVRGEHTLYRLTANRMHLVVIYKYSHSYFIPEPKTLIAVPIHLPKN